jgi:hypothetical protein
MFDRSIRQAVPIVSSKQDERAVVEVKAYGSRTTNVSVLARAAHQLILVRDLFNTDHAILSASTDLNDSEEQTTRGRPGLPLYDAGMLRFLAAQRTDLYRQLEQLLGPAQRLSAPGRAAATDACAEADPDRRAEQQTPLPSRSSPGKALGEALRHIGPGATEFRAYEKAVAEALKYALSDHFAAWLTQHPTEDRLSIYDLIGRVRSEHDFWNAVVTQLHSRYVIFEFKNYSEKIGQSQIYATEKHLYKTALRATGIIVSPKGPDDNAIAAAKGALREHGKLIINLTTDQLIEMLGRKDAGDEPTDVIANIVDDMLMRLER